MTQVNPHIFRAYDIRGIAMPTDKHPNLDLTPETVKMIALGMGIYMQRTYNTKNMAVGRDNRLTSPALQNAFIEGILETGIDVIDIGEVTSPLLYYSVCKYNLDSGVNITASHNPKEYNGIKLIRDHGHSVADQELQAVLKIIQTGSHVIASEAKQSSSNEIASSPPAPRNDRAAGTLSQNPHVFNDYLKDVTEITHLARPLKIVIDCGNGIAGKFAPALFKFIGCEVTELFCDLDGNFPNHEANPEEEHNMQDLAAKVRETGSDLGLGFDGDGDRIGIVDHTGKHYPAEYIIMLLARDYLKSNPCEKIVFDVKVSKNLINDIKKSGGIPIMSKTGHSFIEQKIKEENASLAGENSGHIFFGKTHYNWHGFDDGMFAGVKLLEAFSKENKTFPEHFTNLPKLFSTPELKVPCPDNRKFQIVKEVTEHFTKLYDCITLDGCRINFDENSWGTFRCSNTTPNLTMRFESDTEEKLQNFKEIVFTEFRKYPEVQLPS